MTVRRILTYLGDAQNGAKLDLNQMVRRLFPILLLPLVACGAASPSAPTPVRMPAPIIAPDPTQFDAMFNAQLVHNAFDAPGALQPARLLPADPSIYLQSDGLSAVTIATLEQTARAMMPAMSGGKRTVATFESGSGTRPERVGWIVVDLIADDSANCGRTAVGASAGHMWLNTADRCHRDGTIIGSSNLFAHELGHALGFWHVPETDAMMNAIATRTLPNDEERYHAGLAYQTNGAYSVGSSRIIAD